MSLLKNHAYSGPAALLLAALLLVTSLAVLAEDSKPLALSLIKNRTQPAMLSITVMDHNGKMRQGTGFFVNKNGLFVTNFNLVQNAHRITIRGHDGWMHTVNDVISLDKNNNLALLRAPVAQSSALELTDPNISMRQGDAVVAIGHTSALQSKLSDGQVAKQAQASGSSTLEIDFSAKTAPAYAGGPLVNPYGRVVGVMQSADAGNKAVHVSHVHALMATSSALPLSATWTNLPEPPAKISPPVLKPPAKPAEDAVSAQTQAETEQSLSGEKASTAVETAAAPQPPEAMIAEKVSEEANDQTLGGDKDQEQTDPASEAAATEVAAPVAPASNQVKVSQSSSRPQVHHMGHVKTVAWLPIIGAAEPSEMCPPIISHRLERKLGIRTVADASEAQATIGMGGRLDTGKECNFWGCFDGYRLYMNVEITNHQGKLLFRDYFEVDEDNAREACEELADDIVDELEDYYDDDD